VAELDRQRCLRACDRLTHALEALELTSQREQALVAVSGPGRRVGREDDRHHHDHEHQDPPPPMLALAVTSASGRDASRHEPDSSAMMSVTSEAVIPLMSFLTTFPLGSIR